MLFESDVKLRAIIWFQSWTKSYYVSLNNCNTMHQNSEIEIHLIKKHLYYTNVEIIDGSKKHSFVDLSMNNFWYFSKQWRLR